MVSFPRKSIPAILVFLLNTGLTISGYENLTLAVALWSLMVPAAGFAVWPWIKRIRVGFKPPDADLRKALEERDRWRERFETKQSEVGKLNEVREQQLEKIREVEQELHRLRQENEQLKLENRNQQVDLDQVSKELGQTKHDKANLRHECERLREQNSELRNQRDWQIRVRCRKLANGLDKLLEGWERHDPKNKEALREYNNRFKADANRLIEDLKTYDLWVPQVDDPAFLENPENRQDVQNLCNYVRWVHLGFPHRLMRPLSAQRKTRSRSRAA